MTNQEELNKVLHGILVVLATQTELMAIQVNSDTNNYYADRINKIIENMGTLLKDVL